MLRVLLYYDLFKYPLTAQEILYQTDTPVADMDAVTRAMDELVSAGIVFTDGMFYSVKAAPDIFERRRTGNRNAEAVMTKAYRRAKLIAAFPYVRSVCVSGSLSKNYFDATTDMDFFILAEPNSLWVCRTLLILFKNNKKNVKIVALAIAAAFLFGVAGIAVTQTTHVASAAPASNVGVVNYQMLVQQHPGLAAVQATIGAQTRRGGRGLAPA